MGTVFSIEVTAPGVPGEVLASVVAWLHQVDATFSPYRPDSVISRLDRGELADSELPAEVISILARCAELEEQTGGYFSARAAGALDPSGLVKGWAIERASDMLLAGGSTSHTVNGGGDVQCCGANADGQPWRIGITDPREAGRLVGVAAGSDFAVATSGSAERGAHILDPHTGRPPAGLLSVTVVGPRLATADAYATAAFAMGRAGPEWLERLPGHEALVVAEDGAVWSSPGFGYPD